MKDFPKVTVYTLIYNTNPRYVIDAIKSVRATGYPNLQHIIIDDGSPDPKPKETVKQWITDNDYSCEFHEHEVNYGICKTLNHVLELTKGDYIFGCGDDLISPSKIIQDLTLLNESSEDVAGVYSDANLIDYEDNQLAESFIKRLRDFSVPPQGWIFNELLDGNFIPAMSIMWKVSCIKEIGYYDENLQYEDYDFNLRMASSYKILFNPEVTASYRIHGESLVGKLTNHQFQNAIMYRKHVKKGDKAVKKWKHEVLQYLLHADDEEITKNFNKVAGGGLNLVKFVKKIPGFRIKRSLLHLGLSLQLINP